MEDKGKGHLRGLQGNLGEDKKVERLTKVADHNEVDLLDKDHQKVNDELEVDEKIAYLEVGTDRVPALNRQNT
jgi:hypothetical protein